MIEPVSDKELYEKFHEFYITSIKYIICNITITKNDGAAVNEEMLHRVQEYCIGVFDELNSSKYQDTMKIFPYEEPTALTMMSYTVSSMGNDDLLPNIKERYKDKLSEEEFDMLNNLVDNVFEDLSRILTLSYKFLISTHDIDL